MKKYLIKFTYLATSMITIEASSEDVARRKFYKKNDFSDCQDLETDDYDIENISEV